MEPFRPAAPPGTRSTTWWWFLIPIVSFGLASFVMVFLGGSKLGSRAHMWSAGAYLLADASCFVGLLLPYAPDGQIPPASTALILLYLAVAWLGGTLHTLYLQQRVARRDPPRLPDPAVAAAAWRANRRTEARQLLTTNPATALDLRIGRPDITGRQYDDGGLVDVNHVPPAWLAQALQIPQPLADEIAAARMQHDGFSSPRNSSSTAAA
ncbi:hypothetical protein [Paractinoplanes durhamensis]|uniref:hypothetical protein n=1 Tax=Paractinoplanes durhamensis TaxID=113563 RepID=UPI0036456E61